MLSGRMYTIAFGYHTGLIEAPVSNAAMTTFPVAKEPDSTHDFCYDWNWTQSIQSAILNHSVHLYML